MMERYPQKKMGQWSERANCVGKTDLFFGKFKENVHEKRRREVQAKKLCNECAVRTECREYARANDEFGLWGGETEEERIDKGYLRHSSIKRKINLRLRGLEIKK